MRPLFPLIVALALTPMTFASEAVFADPMGDQHLLELGVGEPTFCSDAATDMRELSVGSVDGVVTIQVKVRDLGSTHVTCSGRSYHTDLAMISVDLAPEPVCNLTCTRPADSVTIMADWERGFGEENSCVRLRFSEGLYSDCLGLGEASGSNITWTLPASGVVRVSNGDARSYDVTGTSVYLSAYADSAFVPAPDPLDLQLGLVVLTDSAYGEDAFTL